MLDLEDGVALSEKPKARTLIAQYFEKGPPPRSLLALTLSLFIFDLQSCYFSISLVAV